MSDKLLLRREEWEEIRRQEAEEVHRQCLERGDVFVMIAYLGDDRRRQPDREQQVALLDAKLEQARKSILRHWDRLDSEQEA